MNEAEKATERRKIRNAAARVCFRNAREEGKNPTRKEIDSCDETDEETRLCKFCPHITK